VALLLPLMAGLGGSGIGRASRLGLDLEAAGAAGLLGAAARHQLVRPSWPQLGSMVDSSLRSSGGEPH
jgi:hypothetical protein